MHPSEWLSLKRSVRFSDSDAAGVMHFQQLLGWCHQAWEESLIQFGLSAANVFPGGRDNSPAIALPIVHCHADFHAPIYVGDELHIEIKPKLLSVGCFEVVSVFQVDGREVARGCIQHVAINPNTRQRSRLPDGISRWLEASTIGGINPC